MLSIEKKYHRIKNKEKKQVEKWYKIFSKFYEWDEEAIYGIFLISLVISPTIIHLFSSSWIFTLIVGGLLGIFLGVVSNFVVFYLNTYFDVVWEDIQKGLMGRKEKRFLKKLTKKYLNGELQLKEIEDEELQVKILQENSDYTSLLNILDEIKRFTHLNAEISSIFGETSDTNQLLNYLVKDMESMLNKYISRNHAQSILEVFKLYPLLYNFSNLLKLFEEDKETFRRNKEKLSVLNSSSEVLFTKLKEIQTASDKLSEITLETDSNIKFDYLVKESILLKEYI